MPKILLLTRHERLGASSRIRFLQFLPALERQGFTFDVHPFFNNAYVRSLYGGPPAGFGSIINSFRRRSKKHTMFDATVAATAKKIGTETLFSFDGWYRRQGFTLLVDAL
jgi:hypothetical protein